MKQLLLPILVVILGLILGAAISLIRINTAAGAEDIFQRNGPWRYAANMDLAENDVQRALIARSGLFALRETEVLYYFLQVDEKGQTLSSQHTYELQGKNFDARYWSYTLYGADDFLIPNSYDRFTLNGGNMVFEDSSQQAYTFYISRDAHGTNWIPAGEGENMSILLRLYNPSPAIYEHVGEIELPTIKKL